MPPHGASFDLTDLEMKRAHHLHGQPVGWQADGARRSVGGGPALRQADRGCTMQQMPRSRQRRRESAPEDVLRFCTQIGLFSRLPSARASDAKSMRCAICVTEPALRRLLSCCSRQRRLSQPRALLRDGRCDLTSKHQTQTLPFLSGKKRPVATTSCRGCRDETKRG